MTGWYKYRVLTAITILYVLLTWIFAPLYSYFAPFGAYDTVGDWHDVYMLEEESMYFFMMPFYALFPLLLILKNKIIRAFIQLLIMVCGGLCFIFGMAYGAPSTDFSGGMEALGLLVILPLSLVFFRIDYLYRKPTN